MSDQKLSEGPIAKCTCPNWCPYHPPKNKLEVKDHINPAHYKAGSPIEVINIIEGYDLNYREGNVIKYILRARRKNAHLEDLKKAQWYLDREIERVENGVDEEGITKPSKMVTSHFPSQDQMEEHWEQPL